MKRHRWTGPGEGRGDDPRRCYDCGTRRRTVPGRQYAGPPADLGGGVARYVYQPREGLEWSRECPPCILGTVPRPGSIEATLPLPSKAPQGSLFPAGAPPSGRSWLYEQTRAALVAESGDPRHNTPYQPPRGAFVVLCDDCARPTAGASIHPSGALVCAPCWNGRELRALAADLRRAEGRRWRPYDCVEAECCCIERPDGSLDCPCIRGDA